MTRQDTIAETERRLPPTCPEVDAAHDKLVAIVARLDDSQRAEILAELLRSHEVGKRARSGYADGKICARCGGSGAVLVAP